MLESPRTIQRTAQKHECSNFVVWGHLTVRTLQDTHADDGSDIPHCGAYHLAKLGVVRWIKSQTITTLPWSKFALDARYNHRFKMGLISK